MRIRDTDAWKAAEWRYSSIQAALMMPFPGLARSPGEIIEELEEIVHECPEFYPAVLELGLRRMAGGADGSEAKQIETGLRLMLDVGDPQHTEEEAAALYDNLENLWRFDLGKCCLEILVERFPDKALFWDYLGNATAQLGEVETALRHSAKALALAPDDAHFRCNHGLFHLMAGNAGEAEIHLSTALRLDPENKVTKGNLEVQKYLARHGGNFSAYLVRPVDKEEIERLSDDEDLERLDQLRLTISIACKPWAGTWRLASTAAGDVPTQSKHSRAILISLTECRTRRGCYTKTLATCSVTSTRLCTSSSSNSPTWTGK